MFTYFKVWGSELVLRSSITGGETFSARVWDQCEPSIVQNLHSQWFIAVIPIQKYNHGWRSQLSGHRLPLNLLGSGREASDLLVSLDPQMTVTPRDYFYYLKRRKNILNKNTQKEKFTDEVSEAGLRNRGFANFFIINMFIAVQQRQSHCFRPSGHGFDHQQGGKMPRVQVDTDLYLKSCSRKLRTTGQVDMLTTCHL